MAKTVATYMQTQIQQGGTMPLLNKAIAPEERFKQIITTLQAFYADGAKSCLLNMLSLGDVAPDLKQVRSTIYNTLYTLYIRVREVSARDWHE